jgi:hypothetical protein
VIHFPAWKSVDAVKAVSNGRRTYYRKTEEESQKMKRAVIAMIAAELLAAVVVFLMVFIGRPDRIWLSVIGAVALGAATAATWKRGFDFLSLSQFMYGISFIAVSICGNGQADIDSARTIFLFSLAVGTAVSILPVSRSITDIAASLRGFPDWFKATRLYRAMDLMFSIGWTIILTAVGFLLFFRIHSYVKEVLIVGGIGSEFLVFALLQTNGYRYWDFLTGRTRKEAE